MNMYILFYLFLLLPGIAFSDSLIEKAESQALQEQNSDVHGQFDVVFKNDYITPRGLLVTNKGVTTQILLGISLDIYKNPNACWLNGISIFAGVWNDLCSCQHNTYVGNWNEFDWYAGLQFKISKEWLFSVQYLELLSPPGNFKAEQNIEFILSYDDSQWQWPITFNPYIKFFWAMAGDSTVVVGKRGKTYDVEIGMLPTWTLKNTSLVITLPTWITVGPPSFWNGGQFGLKQEDKHFGVFSTGLKGIFSILSVPKSLGHWYMDAGIQYYYLINKNLLQAQKYTLNVKSLRSTHSLNLGSFHWIWVGILRENSICSLLQDA